MIKRFLTEWWRWFVKSKTGKIIGGGVGAIVIAAVSSLVTDHFKSRPTIEAFYAVTDTKPYRKDALGQLILKYQSDRQINKFELSVASTGSEAATNVYIDVRAFKPDLFSTLEIVFDPPMLEEQASKKFESPERIYVALPELPINSSVMVNINSLNHFEEKEVDVGVVGS